MLGRKQSDSLNTIRYAQYLKVVASAKSIDPQKLPSMANVACYVLQFVRHQFPEQQHLLHIEVHIEQLLCSVSPVF